MAALPAAEIEALLAERRPELKPQQRALVARLAEGAIGRALRLDPEAYFTSRQDALIILRNALREPDYSQLFRATETYRAGADGQEKTIALLRALGSLLEDLLLIVAGTAALVRNVDIIGELEKLGQGLSIDWIDGAARSLAQVEQGMRRNLLRSLSLDAMAVSLSER